MASIPGDLAGAASQASSLTGLNSNVILAQWIAENGYTVPKNNNFGNIMIPGTNTVQTYPTIAAGVAAYANFLKNNSNYAGIMSSAGGTPTNQLAAIIASPWDEGHYGGDGSNLTNVYNSITGGSVPVLGTGAATYTNGSATIPGTGTTSSSLTLKIFYLAIGGVLVAFGLYTMLNPMNNLTDVIGKLKFGGVKGE